MSSIARSRAFPSALAPVVGNSKRLLEPLLRGARTHAARAAPASRSARTNLAIGFMVATFPAVRAMRSAPRLAGVYLPAHPERMTKSVAACYIPTGSGVTLRFITAMLPGLAAISAAVVASPAETPPAYFPARGAWERRSPAELGLHAARLQAAIDFAIANQNPRSRALALDLAQT